VLGNPSAKDKKQGVALKKQTIGSQERKIKKVDALRSDWKKKNVKKKNAFFIASLGKGRGRGGGDVPHRGHGSKKWLAASRVKPFHSKQGGRRI